MARLTNRWSEFGAAAASLVHFLACAAMSALAALAISYLLAHGPGGLWRFDPRGTFVDTYVQRNAFIVGFMMGFAIIPSCWGG